MSAGIIVVRKAPMHSRRKKTLPAKAPLLAAKRESDMGEHSDVRWTLESIEQQAGE